MKEWASVCHALEMGRQILLLRKGGIYEASGEFEVADREFLLFPTFVHQKLEMLKPETHAAFEAKTAEPQQVTITAAGVVSDILRLESREQMDRLEEEHVWAAPLIDMRFSYKPDNPLYLMLVRAYRLHEPVMLANTPAYAGCKSWVPLDGPVATGGALPVLDDVKYEFRRNGVLEKLARPAQA